MKIQPSRDEFKALAAEHTIVPVWTRGARRPRDAGRRVRQAGRRRARIPARVGRARRAVEPVLVRRPQPVGHAGAARRPARRIDGDLPDVDPDRPGHARGDRGAAARRTRARRSTSCRRCTAASWGILGYDVIREVEHLPDVPADDHGLPDAVMSVIGSLAAFDHWRQRVYMIESVPDPRACPSSSSTTPTTPRRRGSHIAVDRLAAAAAVRAGRAADEGRRAARAALVDARRHVPARRRGRQGVHPRRRHLPGRAGPALRHRARRRSVRRVPGAAPGQPEPVHVLPAPPRDHDRRVVARADGAAARSQGDQPPDRRHPQARRHRRARPSARRRADRASRRSAPST